jgi:Bacterial Ig-like domain (group 3)/FG-GAP-like repeat
MFATRSASPTNSSRVISKFALPLLLSLALLMAAGRTWNFVNATVSAAPGPAATTTALAVSSDGSEVTTVTSGSVVTLTATVLAGSTPVTVGEVNFCDAASTFCTGVHLIGSAQLTSGGTAALKFIPAFGSHSYEAVFAGNGTDAASSSPASPLTVTAAGKSSVVTTLAQSGSAGNLTLTATVAGSVTNSASPAPTGSVSFIDTTQGNSVLGTGTLGSGTFGENWTVSQTPQVGANPKTVLVADLNGDGIPDVVVGNNTNVSVLTGKGDGTFNAANDITALANNPWIAVAPFVNGGPLDILAVSNSTSNTNNAEVIIGNGTGGGTAGAPFSLPFGSASGVVSGDFNGDGQQDFAVIFQLDNKISTFLGNGNGTFQAPTTLATGTTPVSAVVGNFNGHGKIDIAVANSGDNTISIYLGSVSGAETSNPFTVVTPVQANLTPNSIAVGDFNGDGIDDLLVTGLSGGNPVVAIYLGKGAGAFGTPTLIPELLTPSGAVAADVLGNGKQDIVVTTSGASTLDLFLNDGAGNFFQGVIPPSTGNSPMFLAAGNFNGQATQGLAVANNADGTVSVFLPQLTQSATASISGVSGAGLETLRAILASIQPQVPGDNVVAQYNGDANFAGSTSTPIVVSVSNPVPTITNISPANAAAGSGAFTLTVTGTNFVSNSSVLFNGAPRTTTFISSTQLTAAILATDITSTGTPPVVVTNPTPGGGSSNSVTFTITAPSNPVPTVTSLSPASIAAGSAGFTLTVNGTNFVSGAFINFAGTNRLTTFVSSTQLTAAITAADVATAGTPAVLVNNPNPGGGASNSINFSVTAAANPVPTVTTISPTSIAAGSIAFTLTVNGTNFVSNSVIHFNGAVQATTFVNSTQLTTTVQSLEVETAGNAAVTVMNPTPGGGTSNSVNFTISSTANPQPNLTSISPTTISAGSPGFTITLTGTGFISSSVAQWNGNARTTTFVSATQLTALITAADVQTASENQVSVRNPTPGGGNSNSLQFVVTTPVPALTSLAPNSAIAGGAAFTITLNGSNFISTSVAQWNGGTRATTFVSSTQLTAAITAADIATAGTASVQVFTPMVNLGGGANPLGVRSQGLPLGTTSNALTFTITAPNPVPTLTSISPTLTGAGGAAFTMTLTGTNFVSSSVAQWKGSARTTTFVSATQLTAAITAADIASSGTAAITVLNPTPGGGTSNSLTFTITDFSVSATTTSQTVTAGQPANFTIATATVGGAFPGTVTFTASGLPIGASASFSPSSVTAGSPTTMTVTTSARGLAQISLPQTNFPPTSVPPTAPNHSTRQLWLFTLAILLALALTLASAAKFGRRTTRRLVPIGAFALLLISVGYISGCSGGGFPKVGANGTPAGTYTVTVTGTSGSDVHSTTVTLTVQ